MSVGSVAGNIALEGRAYGYVSRTFALQHLMAARYFALRAAEIENAAENQEFGPWFEIFQGYFVGSVILACSSLEALYSETIHTCKLDQSLLTEKCSILKKFAHLNKDVPGSAPLGKAPGQHLCAILTLRDAMVHPEPSFDEYSEKHCRAVDGIKKAWKGHAPSQFFANETNIYRFYTYRCSDWVVTTVRDFAIEVLVGTDQSKRVAACRAL